MRCWTCFAAVRGRLTRFQGVLKATVDSYFLYVHCVWYIMYYYTILVGVGHKREWNVGGAHNPLCDSRPTLLSDAPNVKSIKSRVRPALSTCSLRKSRRRRVVLVLGRANNRERACTLSTFCLYVCVRASTAGGSSPVTRESLYPWSGFLGVDHFSAKIVNYRVSLSTPLIPEELHYRSRIKR